MSLSLEGLSTPPPLPDRCSWKELPTEGGRVICSLTPCEISGVTTRLVLIPFPLPRMPLFRRVCVHLGRACGRACQPTDLSVWGSGWYGQLGMQVPRLQIARAESV